MDEIERPVLTPAGYVHFGAAFAVLFLGAAYFSQGAWQVVAGLIRKTGCCVRMLRIRG